MPQRVAIAALARLLNAARQPVYVLDEELTLVFVNAACCEWLGVSADQVLGRGCRYCAPPEGAGPEAVLAALCPPPDVATGRAVLAALAPPRPNGPPVYRRVRFIPIGLDDAPLAVAAVVAGEDLPEPPPPAPSAAQPDEAAALHDLVRRFRREAAGRYRADRLIGLSPAIRRAQRQVELAAASRCSVLLVGPKGTGRQHLAAALHYAADPDRAGALVPLDCAVLGAELLQSTVAALAAEGPLGPAAAHSTLLLNHADQIPPEIHAGLVAALAGRPFPWRLVATAEQPLEELARRGRFHAELAAALGTLVIELPPLAARREDIAPLAQMFLEECNAAGGKQVARFTPEALDLLLAYGWPGNCDELAAAVVESHRRAGGPEIPPADLPERLHLAAKAAAHLRRPEETIVLDEFLARVERELIHRALARAKGNKAKAARLLGLTRPRLYRRMVQLGLAAEGEGC